MSATFLEIQCLSSERDDRLLIDRLSLSVGSGDIVQVEGPNGSGKTTLLRILSGLSTRYSGEILWRGEPVDRFRAQYQQELLFLGHGAGVKAVLTPRENLDWWATLSAGKKTDAELESALASVGLAGYEDTLCYMLSAGQQRRVNLARLFVSDAALWILDEPFTAIDKQGVQEIEQWVENHASRGGAVILTTHHAMALTRPVQHLRLGDQ